MALKFCCPHTRGSSYFYFGIRSDWSSSFCKKKKRNFFISKEVDFSDTLLAIRNFYVIYKQYRRQKDSFQGIKKGKRIKNIFRNSNNIRCEIPVLYIGSGKQFS